jgi:hypothetical protein
MFTSCRLAGVALGVALGDADGVAVADGEGDGDGAGLHEGGTYDTGAPDWTRV